MKINSLYVCVKNMDRAISFYEQLFGKKIDVLDKRLSRFNINGFSFGLYDPSVDGETVIFGNNVVPNIEVPDADKEYEHLKNIGVRIVLEMMNIDGFILFQFTDTEGNVIEIYSK